MLWGVFSRVQTRSSCRVHPMLPSLLPSRSQESRPGKFGCHATAMTWEMCSKNVAFQRATDASPPRTLSQPALPAHMTYVSTSSAAAASRIRLSSLSAAQIYARFGFLGSMIFDLSVKYHRPKTPWRDPLSVPFVASTQKKNLPCQLLGLLSPAS